MTRHRVAIRNLMIALLMLVLLLLIPAVTFPSSPVRRVLFAVVLYAAVLLLLAAIFVFWARLEHLAATRQQDRAEVKALRAVLTRHIALCEARTVDAEVSAAFALLGEQRSA